MVQNDIYKLVMITANTNGVMYNTFWFREEIAGLPPDQRATLANDFVGTMITPALNGWRACVSNVTNFNSVRVQRMWPYEEGAYVHAVSPGLNGTRTGTPMPNISAQCIGIYTARPGRRGRGRFYLPPPAAADQLNGAWTSTQINALNNAMTTLNGRYGLASGYNVSGFRLGVWSKFLAGPSPPFLPLAFEPITSWAVRGEVRGINRRSLIHT